MLIPPEHRLSAFLLLTVEVAFVRLALSATLMVQLMAILGLLVVATFGLWRFGRQRGTAFFSGLPEDWQKPPLLRAAALRSTQSALLRSIRDNTAHPAATIAARALMAQFDMTGSEMYYRLEHLRLLGLLTKISTGRGQYVYRLSDAYRKDLHL